MDAGVFLKLILIGHPEVNISVTGYTWVLGALVNVHCKMSLVPYNESKKAALVISVMS